MSAARAMFDRSLIEAYARQGDVPRRAVERLSTEDVLAKPVEGTWSIQQLVVHLLESDLAATHRMRRIAAEHRPLLIAYDETAMADRIGYEGEDLRVVTDLFEMNRGWTSAWLRRLPEEAFARAGVHNQAGLVTLGHLVRSYVEHVDHHMKFLREKRERLGKPLSW